MPNAPFGVRASIGLCFAITTGCSPGVVAQPNSTQPNSTQSNTAQSNTAQSNTLASTRAPLGELLESQSCEAFERQQHDAAEAEIRAMREDLTRALEAWRAEQPGCWEEYRRNAEFWSELGDSYGSGGLGLSGIGEGGSGRGEGISLGTVGRGSAQGFGTGHGRLGGSHTSHAPRMAVGATSSTNVQVEGVDEADIVKTDGQHVYLAINGALRIAAVDPPQIVSVTPLPGQVKELFVHGQRAVVYVALGGNGSARCTYGYDCEVRGDGSRTQIVVLDVSRPSAPVIRRKLELSGSLIAARRIEDAVHTVVVDGERRRAFTQRWPSSLPRCGIYESAVKSQLERLRRENERAIRAAHSLPTLTEGGQSRQFCEMILRDPSEEQPAFTTIYSFELNDDRSKIHGTSIRSRPGTVYANQQALYLAVRKQNVPRLGEASDLHKFRLGKRAAETTYLASGTVRGRVLNQFAMDDWQSNLRVATTTGHLPSPNVESQLVVLAERYGHLVALGAVEHLAPGEDIRSVRFDADRAYVVTFKKTDPLFVLDLAKPSAPKVIGELKIPGFSTYLHRIDPNHLISIGFDADDQGAFAYFNGILLQLFDVTHPTEPKLLHRETIGSRGSGSEAATNHLAFNFMAEQGLLAIPSTICEGGGNGRMGQALSFAGLLVYEVDLEHGFRRVGGINHGTAGARCNSWWSQSASAVKRSLFLDDQVWSIAMDRAKVQKLSALGRDYANLRLN